MLALFVTGIAFSTNAGFLTVERGIALTVVGIAWATFRRDCLRRSNTRKVSVNRPEHDAATARRGQLRRLAAAAAVIAVDRRHHRRRVARWSPPATTGGCCATTIVPPFDPKDYVTPLASFRNFVKDKKDDTLFAVKGLPKDARVRLGALDAFNGTNYTMDPNGSGSFSKVGDAKSINTLADSTGTGADERLHPGHHHRGLPGLLRSRRQEDHRPQLRAGFAPARPQGCTSTPERTRP